MIYTDYREALKVARDMANSDGRYRFLHARNGGIVILKSERSAGTAKGANVVCVPAIREWAFGE